MKTPTTQSALRTSSTIQCACAAGLILAAFVVLAPSDGAIAASSSAADEAGMAPVEPAYDQDGRLLLPAGYERWILVGSSLGLSYSEGQAGMQMFHHTLMEPSAYAHFRQTGEFREGTMLALLLHGLGEGALPQRQGQFAAEVHGVEMAVKDSNRVAETWAYYNFGGMNGLREAVSPMPARSCQSCHVEHAAYDNVFLQFYPLLVDAAPEGVLPASLPGALPRRASAAHSELGGEPRAATASPRSSSDDSESTAPLALAGLDPVHLVEGREEMGKPEIVMESGGMRYQFVSEPSRSTFEADPQRYVIQNETCPVVPGAPIDPSLVAVHEGKVYAFASPACVASFQADPDSFLEESP